MKSIPINLDPFPPSVQNVCKRLQNASFQAVLAGGCVRDFLLRRPIADIDLATNAPPEDVVKLFPQAVLVGKQFGVVRIALEDADKTTLEVATFRKDGKYVDFRHPVSVEFGSMEQDAWRRDFTVNALFWDPATQLCLDFTEQGLDDVTAHCLRTVGDPDERFEQDALRLLRAIRFATRLNFAIEPQTFASMKKNMPLIRHISPERIAQELQGILTSDNLIQAHSLLQSVAFDLHLLGEPACIAKVWPLASATHPSWLTKFVALFPEHAQILADKLKFSQKEQKYVAFLVQACRLLATPFHSDSPEHWEFLWDERFDACWTCLALQKGVTPSIQTWQEALEKRPPFFQTQISGTRLQELGYPPGKQLGTMLDEIKFHIQKGSVTNDQDLLAFIQKKWPLKNGL